MSAICSILWLPITKVTFIKWRKSEKCYRLSCTIWEKKSEQWGLWLGKIPWVLTRVVEICITSACCLEMWAILCWTKASRMVSHRDLRVRPVCTRMDPDSSRAVGDLKVALRGRVISTLKLSKIDVILNPTQKCRMYRLQTGRREPKWLLERPV